jgi:hypothetical protein
MRLSLRDFLINKFRAEPGNQYDENQFKIKCPYCPSDKYNKKMYIHLQKQTCFCQRCKRNVTLKILLEQQLGVEVVKLYADLLKEANIAQSITLRTQLLERWYGEDIKYKYSNLCLPKEFISLREDQRSIYAKDALTYLHGRGVDLNTIIALNIGFCAYGRYKDRIIFPCYEGGKVVYFTNRLYRWSNKLLTEKEEKMIFKNGITKTLNQEKEDKEGNVYIGKSEVLYNIDRACTNDYCVIVEGVFDSLKVGEKSIAILGSYVSKIQALKILKCRFKKIYLMLDEDVKFDILLKSIQKFRDLVPLYIVRCSRSDPGSMTKEEIEDSLNSAILSKEYIHEGRLLCQN